MDKFWNTKLQLHYKLLLFQPNSITLRLLLALQIHIIISNLQIIAKSLELASGTPFVISKVE